MTFGTGHTLPLAIAVWVGREIEQDIFTEKRCQIDGFRPVQFRVQRKSRYFYFVHKFFETGNAAHFHWLLQGSVGPERPGRNPNIQIITQWSDATNSVRGKFRNWAILFALQMQSFRWNLFEMNFHSRKLSEFIARVFWKCTRNTRGHELRYVAAQARDLFHDPRTKIRVFFFWHQKNCLYLRLQFAIHQRHLKLEFKIRNRTQSTHDCARFSRNSKIDQQTWKGRHFHVIAIANGLV